MTLHLLVYLFLMKFLSLSMFLKSTRKKFKCVMCAGVCENSNDMFLGPSFVNISVVFCNFTPRIVRFLSRLRRKRRTPIYVGLHVICGLCTLNKFSTTMRIGVYKFVFWKEWCFIFFFNNSLSWFILFKYVSQIFSWSFIIINIWCNH